MSGTVLALLIAMLVLVAAVIVGLLQALATAYMRSADEAQAHRLAIATMVSEARLERQMFVRALLALTGPNESRSMANLEGTIPTEQSMRDLLRDDARRQAAAQGPHIPVGVDV